MKRYRDFRPTACDPKGRGLPNRQDWLVVPVGCNRDSGVLAESNYETALRLLGGESDTVEAYSFDHWVNGWFSVILARPDRKTEVESIRASLAHCRILDGADYSRRRFERARGVWQSMRLAARIETCKRYGVSVFAARRSDPPESATSELIDYLVE